MITSFFKKQDASAKDATDETVSNKRPKLDEPVGKGDAAGEGSTTPQAAATEDIKKGTACTAKWCSFYF